MPTARPLSAPGCPGGLGGGDGFVHSMAALVVFTRCRFHPGDGFQQCEVGFPLVVDGVCDLIGSVCEIIGADVTRRWLKSAAAGDVTRSQSPPRQPQSQAPRQPIISRSGTTS
jgi:hypothetical protein